MENKICIIIADRHKTIRSAVNALVRKSDQFELSLETQGMAEILTFVKQGRADIILLNSETNGPHLKEVLSHLSSSHKGTKVIVTGDKSDAMTVKEFLQAGACAYISRVSNPRTYMKVILAVHYTGRYISDEQAMAISREVIESPEARLSPAQLLTSREIEILLLLCEGRLEKEIVALFNISLNTVHSHRKNIYKKIGVHNSIGLVKYAIKYGLIKGPD